MELPTMGTTSSSVQVSTHLRLGHSTRHLEPLAHHQAHRWDEGAHSEHCACNPHHDEHNDQERHSLSPEGLGPKAFRSNVHDVYFLKCLWALNNVVKCDGKTNTIVWLEAYQLHVGRARWMMTSSSSKFSPST
jgi:hypothetical protein